MSITNINNNAVYSAYAKTNELAQNTKPAKENEAEVKNGALDDAALDADTFEKSAEVDTQKGYQKVKKLSREQIDALEAMREESLRNMVTQLLSLQAKGIGKTKSAASVFSEVNFNMTSAEIGVNAAEASVEEDFYGVNAVATRIMDMAVSLSGGDVSKIETLKNAVIKGFEEAGAAFGQKLPDVCNKTYDEIMKRFDYWTEKGSLEGYAYTAAEE